MTMATGRGHSPKAIKLLDDKRARAISRGGKSRADPRRPSPHNQHIDFGCHR